MVHTTNGLGEDVRDVQDFELGARLPVLMLWYGVGDNHLVDGRSIDTRNCISAEDAVCDQSIHR